MGPALRGDEGVVGGVIRILRIFINQTNQVEVEFERTNEANIGYIDDTTMKEAYHSINQSMRSANVDRIVAFGRNCSSTLVPLISFWFLWEASL
jgi:hypothetical protein